MIDLHEGDCLDVLARLAAEGVRFDACVTDPPYHLTSIVKRFGGDNAAPAQHGTDGAFARASRGFMGKQWDGGDIAFRPETWRLVYDVMKPGAHLVAFSATRTYHRMACAIEDAGFEMRDMLSWLYGSGFPKSHDVAKQIDKSAGHWRGRAGAVTIESQVAKGTEYQRTDKGDPITATATATAWAGWGTALKPACEPIVLARKPLAGTVVRNVLTHGTGALNIDACRIPSEKPTGWAGSGAGTWNADTCGLRKPGDARPVDGRWPANVLHDGSAEVEAAFAEFGELDAPTPARFFYCAKADADDRADSKHATVKPIDLMRWLVRLVTPPRWHGARPVRGLRHDGRSGDARKHARAPDRARAGARRRHSPSHETLGRPRHPVVRRTRCGGSAMLVWVLTALICTGSIDAPDCRPLPDAAPVVFTNEAACVMFAADASAQGAPYVCTPEIQI